MSGDHVVYIVRSAGARLLYVGVTSGLSRRMTVHRSQSSWWSPTIQVEVERFPMRHLANARERELIQALKPPFNREPKVLVLIDPAMQDEIRRVAGAQRVDPTDLMHGLLRGALDQLLISAGPQPRVGPHATGCDCFDATAVDGKNHVDERCSVLALVAAE